MATIHKDRLFDYSAKLLLSFLGDEIFIFNTVTLNHLPVSYCLLSSVFWCWNPREAERVQAFRALSSEATMHPVSGSEKGRERLQRGQKSS